MSREFGLMEKGWEKRFILSGQKLKDSVEVFENSGYEVHLEPVDPAELQQECKECYKLGSCKKLETPFIIFTRN